MAITRTFNGRVYYFDKGFKNKTLANAWKAEMKKQGALVRIIPYWIKSKHVQNDHSVYKYLGFYTHGPRTSSDIGDMNNA